MLIFFKLQSKVPEVKKLMILIEHPA